jgi:hypothetical protein
MVDAADEIAAAVEWLRSYEAFWQVRGRFYALAFNIGESDPRAARTIPGHEELVSLNPVLARGLWDRAMREAGAGLSRETAAKLSALSPTARRAIADAAAEVLGFTPAGVKRFVPAVAAENDTSWDWAGFWDWVARERIAEGLAHV